MNPGEIGGDALQALVSELYEQSRNDVYYYLLTLGLNPAKAQEAAQEVFLRLYATLRKGERIESHRAWIFRVAHNVGLKIRMREGPESPLDEALAGRLRTDVRDPEAELLGREQMTRFRRAVEELSERQRRCLFLRMEGLSYSEIASTLGISASAASEFLRRALSRLRKGVS